MSPARVGAVRPGRAGRGGFALVMVVFLLFAVAVAAATGYLVVSSEFAMARQNRDGQEALALARAGLQRFLGETVGVVGDSVSYAIGNGIATVTTRKIFQQDSLNHLYYVRSEGKVDDIRTPLLPARRAVGMYAWHRQAPIRLKGTVWVSGGSTTVGGTCFGCASATVSGYDVATTANCTGGGTAGVSGLVKGSGGTVIAAGATFESPSPGVVTYSGYESYYDTVGIRWDILTSAAFPVDFDGSPPSGIPSDSFPIVRYRGDLSADGAWSGQGVLIVTGTLFMPSTSTFTWNGIILAGSLGTMANSATPVFRGMVIGGLNGSNPNVTLRGNYRYHSCDAYKANNALSYLEAVDGTLFEVNG